jgi:hypothetical protein
MIDTCYVLNDTVNVVVSNTTQSLPKIPIEIIVASSTLLGIIISIVGNFIFNKLLISRQSKVEIRKQYFNKCIETILEFSSKLWEGYHVILKQSEREKGIYPKAYENLESLKKWLNELGQYLDRNYIIFSDEIRSKFVPLNRKILDDINEINCKGGDDIITRDIGRKSNSDINKYVTELQKYFKEHLNKKYDIEIS